MRTPEELKTIEAVIALLQDVPHNYNDRVSEAISRLALLLASAEPTTPLIDQILALKRISHNGNLDVLEIVLSPREGLPLAEYFVCLADVLAVVPGTSFSLGQAWVSRVTKETGEDEPSVLGGLADYGRRCYDAGYKAASLAAEPTTPQDDKLNEIACYLLAFLEHPCPANRAIIEAFCARHTDMSVMEIRKLQPAAEPTTAIKEQIEAEIEKQLDTLARVSYGVDVRDKSQSINQVIATVVSHSDAMHALLHVRRILRAALIDETTRPQRDIQRDLARRDSQPLTETAALPQRPTEDVRTIAPETLREAIHQARAYLSANQHGPFDAKEAIDVMLGIRGQSGLPLKLAKALASVIEKSEMLFSAQQTTPEVCENCEHSNPHTGSSAGGGPDDPYDACTHMMCNCGFFTPKRQVTSERTLTGMEDGLLGTQAKIVDESQPDLRSPAPETKE